MVPSSIRTAARFFAAALALAGGWTAAATAQEGRDDTSHRSWRHRDGYILSTNDQWLSGDVEMDELAASRGRLHGNFLWFRRSGKTWVVDDPATLDRAVKLFEPLRALEPEQDALREKERALDERETALDDEEESIDAAMERLDADADEEPDDDDARATSYAQPSAEDERQREELRAQMDEIRTRQRDLQAEQRDFESEERKLDAREDRLEREAETSLWTLIDETIASGMAKEQK